VTGAPTYRVAACVCTRNRPETLQETIASLLAAQPPLMEIVVSDDSTDDRTAEVVREFPGVHYTSGPRRGLSANRNHAVDQVAGSDFVLLIDDDCVLGPEFLAAATRCAESARTPSRVVVTGRELNRSHLVAPGRQSFLGHQRVPPSPGERLDALVINSTLFPRTLLQDMPFDERLIYGYEEADMAVRAANAGYELVYCPAAVNIHSPAPENRDMYARHVEASRLYATFKRYAFVERRRLAALAFALIAPPHLLVSAGRRHGVSGVRSGLATLRQASGYVRSYAATRLERVS
jgi:GT2 family glycosyltransferase